MSLLEIKNLTCGYEGKSVVSNVSFAADKGEIVTLIGPNGCGKTTLIKTISTLIPNISGEMKLADKNIKLMSDNERAKSMALLLTDRGVGEGSTCFEVVSMGRYPYTGRFGILSKDDKDICYEAMELCDVSDLSERYFTQISDGQRQRILLARAIAQKPDVMILDEPTSFLDVKYKLEFLNILKELAKKTPFVVVASLHELDLAYQVSDKIIAMKDGIVDMTGTPQEVFKDGYIDSLFCISKGHFEEENLKTIL